MATQFQRAERFGFGDVARRNYTNSDIPAYTLVKLDTANLMNATTGNDAPGITATTANNDVPIGVTLTDCPVSGDNGIVRTVGEVYLTADGNITAGTQVMPSSVNAGNVVAYVASAGNSRVGVALEAGSATNVLLIQLNLNGPST